MLLIPDLFEWNARLTTFVKAQENRFHSCVGVETAADVTSQSRSAS